MCVVTLVRLLVLMGQTVLLTSYTHSALDNILLKLKVTELEWLGQGHGGQSTVAETGWPEHGGRNRV